PAAPPDPDARVEIVRLGDEWLEVQTHSRTPAFLVLADVMYRGWQARVNGRLVPIVRTDYVLRGVSVPAGDSTVMFVFRPLSFYAGATLSLLACVTAAGLLIWEGWRRKAGDEEPQMPAAAEGGPWARCA